MPRNNSDKFPLFLHATGQWAKKIQGKLWYFGKDRDEALIRYLDERSEIEAGRNPRKRSSNTSNGCSLRTAVNGFLAHKERQVKSGELSRRTFDDYFKTCGRLVEFFGRERTVESLAPTDFGEYRDSFPEWSLTTIAREIRQARIVFKFAWDEGLIESPVKFGQSFKEPKKASKRKERNRKEELRGLLEFSAGEVQQLLQHARPAMRAMIYLGLNCGFGNSDCANVSRQVIDLETGWIEYSREKTGVKRKCHLWPETITAISLALNARPLAKAGNDECVFLTRYGARWVRTQDSDRTASGITVIDSLASEFTKLLKACGVDRRDVGFYTLRRTFETIAGDLNDQIAVDVVMGHVDDSMAAIYRQRVFEPRLTAVSEFVRQWLKKG